MPTWGEWEYLSRPSRSKGFDMVWLKHIFSPWFDASDAALLCVVLRLLLSLKFGPMSLSVKRSNSWADQIWGQKNTVEALPITLPSKPLGCKKLAHNFSTKLSLFAKKKTSSLINQGLFIRDWYTQLIGLSAVMYRIITYNMIQLY